MRLYARPKMTFEVTAAQLARAHWFTVNDLLNDTAFYLEQHGKTLWLVNHRDGYTWRILPDGRAEKYSNGQRSADGVSDTYYPIGDSQPPLVFSKSAAIAKSLEQDPPLHDWRS